jgi:hypothetical protein
MKSMSIEMDSQTQRQIETSEWEGFTIRRNETQIKDVTKKDPLLIAGDEGMFNRNEVDEMKENVPVSP